MMRSGASQLPLGRPGSAIWPLRRRSDIAEQLARHFYLDDADRAFIGARRGDNNRLGVAVQIGSLRLLGTFLEDPAQAPASVTRFASNQSGTPSHRSTDLQGTPLSRLRLVADHHELRSGILCQTPSTGDEFALD